MREDDSHDQLLLVICDVLVFKALEMLGKRIVRADRSRYRILGTTPFHCAHTVFRQSDDTATKGLRSAWDLLPLVMESHGIRGVTSAQVATLLTEYVRDLAITGTPHQTAGLAYRLTTRLGLRVALPHSREDIT